MQEYDRAGARAIFARKTETFLEGKELSQEVLLQGLNLLQEEIQVQGKKRTNYRQTLVGGFFYKFYSSIFPVDEKLKSVAKDLFKSRGKSTGAQAFDRAVLDEHAPVSSPVPKFTGKALASGDAKFIDDLPSDGYHFGSLVLSTRGNTSIASINTDLALQSPGVVGFVSAKDIPGENNYSILGEVAYVFAYDKVEFHGQPIGLIVADTIRHAEAAAALVSVQYNEEKSSAPIISTEQAKVKKESNFLHNTNFKKGEVDQVISQSKHQAQGKVYSGSQQHFYMEPQTCDVQLDEENSLIVHSANQWPVAVHSALARVTKLPQNKVRVICRRAGGGFGGKLTHQVPVACAAAVAAIKFKVKLRVALNRNIDMRIAGGREETTTNYRVGFDDSGKIEGVHFQTDLNSGYVKDLSWFCTMAFANAISQSYNLPAYNIDVNLWKTNLPPRTTVRGPSEISSSYCMETVIEHIAQQVNKSSDEIRRVNFLNSEEVERGEIILPNGSKVDHFTIPKIWEEIKEKVNEEKLREEILQFNTNNRWKKRGVAKTPVRYEVGVWAREAVVTVFADGTIVVHHGTSDIGQGAHEKVIQTVSYEFGSRLLGGKALPMDLIRGGDVDNFIVPNATFTGGSTSSESSCMAAVEAVKQIVERLAPVRDQAKKTKEEKGETGEVTWNEIVGAAAATNVNLSAKGYCNGAPPYQNYGGCLSTVEIDVITGDVEILKSYILYDCGKALNPAIDIGQAEGAYIMGVGFILREDLLIDQESGELISEGTWEYKPPSYRDIPQDFTVELLSGSPFPRGFLSSKASGEPPLVLANSVAFAIRDAVTSARKDIGLNEFFPLDTPITPDKLQFACGVQLNQFQ